MSEPNRPNWKPRDTKHLPLWMQRRNRYRRAVTAPVMLVDAQGRAIQDAQDTSKYWAITLNEASTIS